MKTVFITCFCSIALAWTVLGQSPTAVPQTPAAATPVATATVSPAAADDDLESRIEKKIKRRLKVAIGDHGVDIDPDIDIDSDGDIGDFMAIPIIAIIFTTVFGAPVLIVGVIMLINYFKARSLHRTIRTMVEKGQPVPAALLAAPPAPRPRSDMRRGIVLVMVGIGLTIFFGATAGWDAAAWSLGVIPFLIGVGYLIVWKLEGKKDIPPPVS